jgi:hypothetical protein
MMAPVGQREIRCPTQMVAGMDRHRHDSHISHILAVVQICTSAR